MKLLIVDDSKAMRAIVRRTLRQAGYSGHEISEATNGKEALELIQQAAPDLVLCDWNMPEMTGIELLNAVTGAGIHLKFGFITSESTAGVLETAREAGAEFLITKPFTPERFQEALGGILN